MMEGELVVGAMKDWLARADELAASGRLDLSRLTRVDSAGAAYLIELTRRAGKLGKPLEFVNAGPQLRGLIEFLEIDGVLKLAS